MRIVLMTIAAVLVAAGVQAKPVDKVTALPFAVTLEWTSPLALVNAIRVDCRIHDTAGKPVGRGIWESRPDLPYMTRKGSAQTVLPALVARGTDPEEGLTCDCRARFDLRHGLFRRNAGGDRFGRLPWMFARTLRTSSASCKAVPPAEEKHS